MNGSQWLRFLVLAGAALMCAGCRQERKHVHGLPAGGGIQEGIRQSDLQPGPPIPARHAVNPFEGNAHAIGEGKKLYDHYNCSGCHANGGGAIGPALMDDQWIYGSAPANIFSTIVEGRPQGMPAYGGRIPEYQVWQIVSFVRSMSDLSRDTAAAPLTRRAETESAPEVSSR